MIINNISDDLKLDGNDDKSNYSDKIFYNQDKNLERTLLKEYAYTSAIEGFEVEKTSVSDKDIALKNRCKTYSTRGRIEKMASFEMICMDEKSKTTNGGNTLEKY